jgi:outer membrane protein
MKQTRLTVHSIFALSIITLLFIQCKNQATSETSDANTPPSAGTEHLPFAFVNVDSLLSHFELYNHLASSYEDKVSKHNGTLNAGYQKLQDEVIKFQQKAQTNAFLSQERLTQEQNRIQRMKDDLDKQATQVEQELALENQMLQQQISDSLALGIKDFNNPQKYQMIFAKSGNSILYADAHYDITALVIEFLNKRFKVE